MGSHLIGVGSHISSPARDTGPESNLLISKLETLTRRCSDKPHANNQAIFSCLFPLRIQSVAAYPAAYFQPQDSDSSGSGQMPSFSYAFLYFFPPARPRIAAATIVPSSSCFVCSSLLLPVWVCHYIFLSARPDLETMTILHVSRLGMLHAAW